MGKLRQVFPVSLVCGKLVTNGLAVLVVDNELEHNFLPSLALPTNPSYQAVSFAHARCGIGVGKRGRAVARPLVLIEVFKVLVEVFKVLKLALIDEASKAIVRVVVTAFNRRDEPQATTLGEPDT